MTFLGATSRTIWPSHTCPATTAVVLVVVVGVAAVAVLVVAVSLCPVRRQVSEHLSMPALRRTMSPIGSSMKVENAYTLIRGSCAQALALWKEVTEVVVLVL